MKAKQYIDSDVLEMMQDFINSSANERNIKLDLVGFTKEYKMENSQTHVILVLPETNKTISLANIKNDTKIASNYIKLD